MNAADDEKRAAALDPNHGQIYDAESVVFQVSSVTG
jgi:hypothetical protein